MPSKNKYLTMAMNIIININGTTLLIVWTDISSGPSLTQMVRQATLHVAGPFLPSTGPSSGFYGRRNRIEK